MRKMRRTPQGSSDALARFADISGCPEGTPKRSTFRSQFVPVQNSSPRAIESGKIFWYDVENRKNKSGETMSNKCDPIAVFDSGVGGISVLRYLIRQMPGERFWYYGDSANAPYGTRSREAVRALTFAALRPMLERGVKAVVVACNTATSAAITALREAYPDTIIIGIEPALKLAADHFPGGNIGVMATPMTLREEKFSELLHRCGEHAHVTLLPAPEIVELVEAGKGDSPEMDVLLQKLLGSYRGKLDAVVLGCTHYPFASAAISRVLGAHTVLLDGGEGTARETERRLAAANLLEHGEGSLLVENSRKDRKIIDLCYSLLGMKE